MIPVQSNGKDKIKIPIHPDRIHIVDQKINKSDTRFSHIGCVTQLGIEKNKIRAVVDIGIPVSVLMDKSEYDLHRLRLNDSVVINFDIDGITIL